jgi:hypothetical protein
MTGDELVGYIFGQGALFCPAVSRWVRASDRFRAFVEEHKERIRNKVTEAQADPDPDEKLKDSQFELKMAYLMLKVARFSEVKYEFYGDGPDYTVVDETGVTFNVEVKRIRKTREEKRLEVWRGQVGKNIRVVPSALAAALNIGVYVNEREPLLDLLTRLEGQRPQVVDRIINLIRDEEENIATDQSRRYPIPGFEGEVELVLRKPSGKPRASHTSFYGGAFPLFFTQQEWRQFKEHLFPKRDQRIRDRMNVLAIGTDSSSHDERAFIEELESDFEERVAQDNVTEQMRKLSGVLFRGAWGEFFWHNRTAYYPVPTDIAETLILMD